MEAPVARLRPADAAGGETVVGSRAWRRLAIAALVVFLLLLGEGLRGEAWVLWPLGGLLSALNLVAVLSLRRRPPQLVLDEQGFAFQSLGRPWARYRWDEIDNLRPGWSPPGLSRLRFEDRQGRRHSLLLENYLGARTAPEIRRDLLAAYAAAYAARSGRSVAEPSAPAAAPPERVS